MSSGGGAERLAKALGAVGLTGSVTDPADLAALVDRAWERYGRIDAVVNNTGHPPKGPLLELSDEAWHMGLDLLLLEFFLMLEHFETPDQRFRVLHNLTRVLQPHGHIGHFVNGEQHSSNVQ